MTTPPDQATRPQERFDVHVCLVSAQATPNLAPVLDPAFAPRRLVMLVSEDMRDRARWLEEVVRPCGVSVERIDVSDPWDLAGLCDRLMDWLAAQGKDTTIALNATGGTKPMAMAAQQVFALEDRPVFYVHHETNDALWLTPRRPATRLAGKLKFEPFLHAHGWKVMDRPKPPVLSEPVRRLAGELALQVGSLEKALGTLNWYAHQCEEARKLDTDLDDRDRGSAGFMSLVEKFAAAGACSLQRDRLRFPDEESRFFCNGGWLEHYVAETVNALRDCAGIQDVAAGMKVRAIDNRLGGTAGSNELDVAFIARSRMHIVECKTRSFRDGRSAAGAVYKLDALTALGGLNTRGLLVSYRQLSDGDRQRARDLRIHTIVGRAISRLQEELLRWIGSPAR